MSVGMMLISVELLFMLAILLFIPSTVAGARFLGFAIGESPLVTPRPCVSRAVSSPRSADIGSDLMKVVFKIKEDDARTLASSPTADGAMPATSAGLTADGFEITASPAWR
ncbi:MAG: sodium/proton-translocating pyrophosphatase [Gemmatimonadales bacterium]